MDNKGNDYANRPYLALRPKENVIELLTLIDFKLFLFYFLAPAYSPMNFTVTSSGPHSILAKWQVRKINKLLLPILFQ